LEKVSQLFSHYIYKVCLPDFASLFSNEVFTLNVVVLAE